MLLDELEVLIRGRLIGSQPTWRHVRSDRAVQTFGELPASVADNSTGIGLSPGGYTNVGERPAAP